MLVKNLALEAINNIKYVSNDWNINKVLGYLEVDSISEGIRKLEEKINKSNINTYYSEFNGLDFYFHFYNNELVLTTNRKNFYTDYSKDVFKVFVESDTDKIRLKVLFYIAGGLTSKQKLDF